MNTETNFMSFENLTKLIEEHKKETHHYKRYEFDGTIYTLLLISINNLIKENQELKERIEYLERSNNRREDTILEQRQKIGDLEDNWNKLEKWIYEEHCLYIPEIAKNSTYQLVFSKMQEIERSDK